MERVAVVGLGYVGLPVALGFARHYPGTIGFDVKRSRVEALRQGEDITGEVSTEELRASSLIFTDDATMLQDASFIIITVPTPVDARRQPDLEPLRRASEMIGRHLKPGAVVVYESTVYPGVTEDICGPILESASGLIRGKDFYLGYSPERINPGDHDHRLETIVKVVSGENAETLERIAKAYGTVISAGIFKATSIKVAEAAKVIENTQRDLNIALMNELAIIFDRLGLSTKDVLAAAGTKWNFLKFTPGLVGGHCIGVDPYYLTAKAQEVGLHPEVILAGRRTNDTMGSFVATKLVKLLSDTGCALGSARVGILGLTFKENVPDLRNSKVIDIVNELSEFGIKVLVCDPLAIPEESREHFGISLSPLSDFNQMDAVIFAVPHKSFLADGDERIFSLIRPGGVIIDVKSALNPTQLPAGTHYWSL